MDRALTGLGRISCRPKIYHTFKKSSNRTCQNASSQSIKFSKSSKFFRFKTGSSSTRDPIPSHPESFSFLPSPIQFFKKFAFVSEISLEGSGSLYSSISLHSIILTISSANSQDNCYNK
ncbi:hypothetical protein QQP08_005571 [Theobroma cacao]|nr:hypothetical protein QQP08_005571 [Theobroma cacao]